MPSSTPPAVSVVIPARNAAATLRDQLEAIVSQAGALSLEVVVVDNGSTDGTGDLVRSMAPECPVELRVVREEVPGINNARNAGIAAARGDMVLLCDADDVVQPGWVSGLVEALGRADVAGGWVETASLNEPGVARMWGLSSPLHNPTTSPWGCNFGFRREVWDAVGGFDRSLSGHNDEVEFVERAKMLGRTVEITSAAVVAYRLRSDPSHVIRRMYQNGRVEALMAKRTNRPRSFLGSSKRAVLDWGWLLVTSPKALVHREFRWTWQQRLAAARGRIRGSFEHRIYWP